MKIKLSKLFLLIAALCSACSGFDPQAYVPGLYTPTPTPLQESATPMPLTATVPVSTVEPNVIHKVCTNIPDGKLNVRFEAGDQSEVRGYLVEGEIVTLSGEHTELNGSLWIKLSHPVEGWVNTKFICTK
jgi:uncharacterized protein YgiM (DUF1202 family)